ncbi:neuropeptide S receptor-like [Terrapene carolina triunguis]|uniref:neuropeptide S receptor-like n=1 Tax=Terrapene triunguis TaxID=2587831 RepID=UPI0011568A16|nr:neuropeptide S receptor-like [Terrapene carolina triunguis]
MTFTEVVEDEDWGSFYYSFKTEQLVTLWILFIVTVAGNSIVLLSTWKRKRKSRMTFFVTQLAITDGRFCASYTHRGIISKAKVKAIKYSIVIILAFVLCWSPYFLFDILDNFNVLPQTKKRFYASVIIQNLPSLNSAVNPLIYCIFSNILCRPFFGKRRARNLGGTFKDRTDGQEMQAVSKPEYI